MANYFISIGGTGARVARSIINLCLVGAVPVNEFTILFVDADENNKDVNNCFDAIKRYNRIREAVHIPENDFIRTEIKLYNTRFSTNADGQQTAHILSPVREDYDTLYKLARSDREALDLLSVLFTKKEQELTVDQGFHAHPAIGTIFFSDGFQFNGSEKFQDFVKYVADSVQTDNKTANVMVCGSLFGGTGASGIPSISKIMKKKFEAVVNETPLNLGGLFMLPYFSFEPKTDADPSKMEISFETFTLNSVEALNYYNSQGCNDTLFDKIYTIGFDELTQVGKYSEGGKTQHNKAHIAELYAGLAAVNFFSNTAKDIKPPTYVTAREDGELGWSSIPAVSADIKLSKLFSKAMRTAITFMSFHEKAFKPGSAKEFRKGGLFSKRPGFDDYKMTENDETLQNFSDMRNVLADFVLWCSQLSDSHNINITLFNRDAVDALYQSLAMTGGAKIEDLQKPENFGSIVEIKDETLDQFNVVNDAVLSGANAGSRSEAFKNFINNIYKQC